MTRVRQERGARDSLHWMQRFVIVVIPHSGPLEEKAVDEMVRRAGTEEAVAEIVRQRVALAVPLGALQDWEPPAPPR